MSKQAFRATAHGVCLLLWVDHLLPLAKKVVSLVDGFSKPAGTYLVGDDGRLVSMKRRGRHAERQDKSKPPGSA